MTNIHVCWTIDCEATQQAVNDVGLGIRAIQGAAALISEKGLRATLFVLPGDAAACPAVLRDLDEDRFELGLHFHPQEEGHDDFCGAYSEESQRRMYGDAIKKFADAVGIAPRAFRTGSCSANDATFRVTAELGFDCCSHSMPGRNMTQLRSNWVGAPHHVHYANPANRLLEGGLDLVEAPVSTDPSSMLWSGGHPQDLRVELFDAKNQRYLIDRLIAREKTRPQPVKAIVALTHNTYEYDNPADFRRQTMKQMMDDFVELAVKHDVNLVPATISEIAAAHRAAAVSE
jgi:peptidoglycan/xylan/chitin deacetylase (PgdA/CDA1 family)